MVAPAVGNFAIFPGHSLALVPSGYIDNVVLAAGVAKTVTIPDGANIAMLNCTENFYAHYIMKEDSLDLVDNGDFATDTVWTKGTGWTISAGKATSDASQSGNSDLIESVTGLIQGRAYLVTFTVSGRSAGNVRAVIGSTAATNRATNATFTEVIIAGGDGTIALRADANFDGSVDDFSVAPVASVPVADNNEGSGVDLNPVSRYVSNVQAMSIISASNCIVSISYFK